MQRANIAQLTPVKLRGSFFQKELDFCDVGRRIDFFVELKESFANSKREQQN